MRHSQVKLVLMVAVVASLAFAGEALSVDLGMTGAVKGEGKKLSRATSAAPAAPAPQALAPTAPVDSATQGVPPRPRIISTVAGSASGFYGDGMSATVAQLSGPTSVALDSSGNMYIGDGNNRRVRKVSAATGLMSTVAGTGVAYYSSDGIPATSAALWWPNDVAVDASGNLYIADRESGLIRKVSAATGLINTVAGGGTIYDDDGDGNDGLLATSAGIGMPTCVAFDKSGNLFFEESALIRKVDVVTGLLSTVAGVRLEVGYNGDGIPATSAQLTYPWDIALDSSGNTYIADFLSHRVRKVDAGTGLISTLAGTGVAGYNGDGIPATSAQLNEPRGVIVDASGNVYIADMENNRVRKVDAGTGLISTVAGTGVAGFNGDGIPATSTQLKRPRGMALDTSGNLYIADFGNGRIRKVSP